MIAIGVQYTIKVYAYEAIGECPSVSYYYFNSFFNKIRCPPTFQTKKAILPHTYAQTTCENNNACF